MATLDYEPVSRRWTKSRIARIFLVIAWTLFAPGFLLAASVFTIDPVGRHWVPYPAFNSWLAVDGVCGVIGVLAGITAGVLGAKWGWFLGLMNMFNALIVPSFVYA